MLTGSLRDLRVGLRVLWKSRSFTAVAVLTLALGIASTTAIFSIVHATFIEPLPYRDPDRLVMVWSQYEGRRSMVGPVFFVEWKRQATVFEALDGWGGRTMDLSSDDRPEQIQVGVATPQWLPMFGYGQPLALGRNFLEHEGSRGHDQVVILSNRFWRERFGADPAIVGGDIRLNRKPYTVVGVLAAGPADANYPAYVPLAFEGYAPPTPDVYDYGLHVMGRLKPGVTIEQANAHMEAVSRNIERLHSDAEGWAKGWTASVEPFRNNFLGDGTKRGLWLLLAAVAFVLLIACANVANLLLARGASRQRELAVRAAIGASRGQIVRQLLAESLVLALAGGALGVTLAWGVLKLTLALMPPDLLPTEADIRLSIPVLLVTLAVSMLSGVLFGAVPAWQAARANVSDLIKAGGRTTEGGGWMRRALVAGEFALAMTLVAAGGLAVHSLFTLANRDLGFRTERLLTFSLTFRDPQERFTSLEQMAEAERRLLEEVQALPGVESASLSGSIPVLPQGAVQFTIAGQPGGTSRRETVGLNVVSPEYFDTFGIRIVRGRGFDAGDRPGSIGVATVNEAFVRRYLTDHDPLTARLLLPSWLRERGPAREAATEWRVVGVHENVRSWGPGDERHPEIYVPFWQTFRWNLHMAVLGGGEPTKLLPAIAAAIRSVDPDLPMADVKTMEQVVSDSMVSERFNTVLFGGFALVGLLLAAFGIYGVMSFVVAQRTHEIGVRMALGADRRRILRHVLRDGMVTAALGALIGSAGAFVIVRAMQGVVWGVSGLSLAALAVISAVLLTAALVACLVPAVRAASVDPMVALREE